MILSKALGGSVVEKIEGPQTIAYRSYSSSTRSNAGKVVDQDSSRTVATAYRAVNIISDDIAKMPLQLFEQAGEVKERVKADARIRNISYLLEIEPNVWGWTPFQLKKVWAQWLLLYGNAYIWKSPQGPNQLMILAADVTFPVFDGQGSIWYRTMLGGKQVYVPGAEVLHTLINPDTSGHIGRGVIEYARDAIGRQIGAYDTEDKLFKQGLTPAAYMQVSSNLDAEGRKRYRDSYGEVMNGDYDGTRLAVFDQKITKFEPITMKLVDAQFLELIGATDRDIANFFGMPLHMLNMGSQSYSSNEQKYLEYLNGTLDSYLVQIEQGARIKWLSQAEQPNMFFKFNRDSLLRMDAKGRAETNEILIRSGQRTPNEARNKDDYSPYAEGDSFFMTKNYSDVTKLDEGGVNG
jgi:HK97 family phage portal protein